MLFAFAAGVAAVLAAWEAAVAVERGRVIAAVGAAIAPLRAAGRTGVEPDAAERRRLVLLLGAVLLGGGWLLAGPVVGVASAAAGPFAVGQLLAARRRRHAATLADGAPDAARALADALSGGHSVRGAIEEAARAGGLGHATDAALGRTAAALALGEPTEAVLEDLRRRAGHPAWTTLVAAVLLQRDAGGALASLLRELADDLEATRRAEAEARSATAQARVTAQLVLGIPAVALVLAELGDPGLLAGLLADPLSRLLVLASLVLQATALALVRRLARPAAP